MPRPYTIEHARTWIEAAIAEWNSREPSRLDFVIAGIDSSEFLGAIGVRLEPERDFADTGYWVRRSARRCGIGAAALRLIGEWVPSRLGITTVRAMISAANEPSWRLAERCGFFRERECAGVYRYMKKADAGAQIP